jgi:hypothetical protein
VNGERGGEWQGRGRDRVDDLVSDLRGDGEAESLHLCVEQCAVLRARNGAAVAAGDHREEGARLGPHRAALAARRGAHGRGRGPPEHARDRPGDRARQRLDGKAPRTPKRPRHHLDRPTPHAPPRRRPRPRPVAREVAVHGGGGSGARGGGG